MGAKIIVIALGFQATKWWNERPCRHLTLQLKNGNFSSMNAQHRKTLAAIFQKPARSDLKWAEIEALFLACGGSITQGSGSRVGVEINGILGRFHRPHPRPETDMGAVKSVRRFLEAAGVKPQE